MLGYLFSLQIIAHFSLFKLCIQMFGHLPFTALLDTNIMLCFLMITHIMFGPFQFAKNRRCCPLLDPFSLMCKHNLVSVLALQTDNGKEYDSTAMHAFLALQGTVFRLFCPYTSQQNGKAERVLRTLNDSMRTMLVHSAAPLSFWGEALQTAAYLLNRRPCRATEPTTPHQLLLGAPPCYDNLRVFGCLCYPNTASTAAHKLSPRSVACVFLGYPATTAATGATTTTSARGAFIRPATSSSSRTRSLSGTSRQHHPSRRNVRVSATTRSSSPRPSQQATHAIHVARRPLHRLRLVLSSTPRRARRLQQRLPRPPPTTSHARHRRTRRPMLLRRPRTAPLRLHPRRLATTWSHAPRTTSVSPTPSTR
jgi:hypothetical protein